MNDFRFEASYALQFLWFIPVLFAAGVYFARRQKRLLDQHLGEKLRPFLTSSVSEKRRLWKRRMELLALSLLLLAYARPQTGEGRQKVKNEGIELMLLMDVSNSMLAEDVRPSRLEVAKSEVNRLIEKASGNRIGLIAFAGSAVLLSPMTTDKEAIKSYVESLGTEAVATQGTDFSRSLNEALDAMERGGLGPQDDAQVTRAVILVSDGEDQESGAVKIANALAKQDIFIFSLGLGTEQGGAIPVRDQQGTVRGYKRDSSGQVIMSRTKGEALKELARVGRGSFYHLTLQGSAVDALYNDLTQLKKTQFETGEVRSYKEYFQVLLLMAFVIAVLELLLGDRQAPGRLWKGRFEVASD